MTTTISYQQCPACGSSQITQVLKAIDYTVSNEQFDIWHCQQCTMRFTQNVATLEHIGKYYQSTAYVSHSDTQEGLINQLYHRVRNFTLRQKQRLLQKITGLKKGCLLDVGAGTGAFAHTMQQAGWTVTGLEPDDTARRVALDKYQLSLNTPESLYQLTAASFDAITLWHVLEHVHDLQGYLQQFNQLLSAKGSLIIAVPNYTSFDAHYYQAQWAAYDVPRHLYHFSPKSMQLLATKHGFKLTTHYPMWFDSVYVSMLSEQYKNGKSSFIKALFIGLWSNLPVIGNATKCSSVIYVLKKI